MGSASHAQSRHVQTIDHLPAVPPSKRYFGASWPSERRAIDQHDRSSARIEGARLLLVAPILPYASAHSVGKIEVARRGEVRALRTRRVETPARDRVEQRDAQRLVSDGGADAFDRDAPVRPTRMVGRVPRLTARATSRSGHPSRNAASHRRKCPRQPTLPTDGASRSQAHLRGDLTASKPRSRSFGSVRAGSRSPAPWALTTRSGGFVVVRCDAVYRGDRFKM